MGIKETILLADDDFLQRASIASSLKLRGHTVVAQASSVDEVEAIADTPDITFRVALLDERMPHAGDGERAAAILRKRREGVFIISLSSDNQTFGDANVSKNSGGMAEVAKVISEL